MEHSTEALRWIRKNARHEAIQRMENERTRLESRVDARRRAHDRRLHADRASKREAEDAALKKLESMIADEVADTIAREEAALRG
eukprot:6273880-Prymnesium_polylepis.1